MKYVKPDLELMRRVAGEHSDNEDIALDVYCSENVLFREFFWFRLWMLTRMIRRLSGGRGTCLDFGGGSGVFMPTLATGFERVQLIDLNADQARELKDALSVDNVTIVSADIVDHDFGEGKFDAIVAADVLEHFQDLQFPLDRLKRWLADDGYLFTSLPTENIFYRGLRIPFRKQKPADHYHTARHVEKRLRDSGFRKVMGWYHPLFVPLFPLFRISAWQKS